MTQPNEQVGIWTLDNVHRGPAPRGVEEGVPGTVQQLLQAVPHHCEGHQCGGVDKFIFFSHFFPNMLPNISYFITFTVIYFLRAYIQVIFLCRLALSSCTVHLNRYLF